MYRQKVYVFSMRSGWERKKEIDTGLSDGVQLQFGSGWKLKRLSEVYCGYNNHNPLLSIQPPPPGSSDNNTPTEKDGLRGRTENGFRYEYFASWKTRQRIWSGVQSAECDKRPGRYALSVWASTLQLLSAVHWRSVTVGTAAWTHCLWLLCV